MLGEGEAGLYAVALQFGDIVYLFPVTLGMISFPLSFFPQGCWWSAVLAVLPDAPGRGHLGRAARRGCRSRPTGRRSGARRSGRQCGLAGEARG